MLLHGWGLNSGCWHSVLATLAEQYQVITIDLPGFGENVGNCPDEYSLINLSQRIAAYIPEDAIVLGWSMGGLVAQQLAIDNKIKLKALVTLASTPCFEQKTDWHGIKPAVLNLFERQLENDYEQTISRFLAIQALGSPSAKSEIRELKRAISAHSKPSTIALRSGLKLLSTVDLRDQIKTIIAPTLRMYGRLDSLVPADGIESIQRLQPQAESVVFKHAAHAPFMSHPNEWLTSLNRFIASLDE